MKRLALLLDGAGADAVWKELNERESVVGSSRADRHPQDAHANAGGGQSCLFDGAQP